MGLSMHKKPDSCICAYNIGVRTLRKAVNTRDQILNATDRLMAKYGFRRITIDDIAKEAGVAKRTIYLHFEGKEDLGLSSIGRVVEAAHDRMKEIFAGEGDPEERLRSMLIERVMHRVRSVSDYHLSLDELFEAVRPAYMERRKNYFLEESDLIAQVLAEGKRLRRFQLDNPHATADTLLLATNAFLPYSLSVRDLGRPDEIEKRLARMVDLLVRGLMARFTLD